jgi:hypothetical protein
LSREKAQKIPKSEKSFVEVFFLKLTNHPNFLNANLYIIFLSFDQIQFLSKASKSDKTFYAENKKKTSTKLFSLFGIFWAFSLDKTF